MNPEELDPGVRRLVMWLRAHGFETTDSGDGVSKGADGLDFPHVFMVVRPDLLVIEANHLQRELVRAGVAVTPEREPGPSITASYDPTDGIAVLGLLGVTDADIPEAA